MAILPFSSVHGISQARILERVVISYSRGSSQPRDRTHASCISYLGREVPYHGVTWDAQLSPCHSPYFVTVTLSSSFSGFHCHFCKTGIIRPSLLTSQSCQKNEMKQLRHQNSELLKLSARGWFVGTFAAVKCCSDCPEYLSGGLTLGRQLCSLCHRK